MPTAPSSVEELCQAFATHGACRFGRKCRYVHEVACAACERGNRTILACSTCPRRECAACVKQCAGCVRFSAERNILVKATPAALADPLSAWCSVCAPKHHFECTWCANTLCPDCWSPSRSPMHTMCEQMARTCGLK